MGAKIQKPPVRGQGKAIVERCEECDACQEWLLDPPSAPPCTRLLVMMPDGDIRTLGTARSAFRAIETWFRENSDPRAFNVGRIEWRDGIAPPKAAR